MSYFYRHYVRPRYYSTDSKLVTGIALGVTALGIGSVMGLVVYDSNKQKEAIEELNTKIEKDLDLDSFNAQSVIFDKTNENFILRISGTSDKEEFVAADYKVNPQDFYNLKNDKNDVLGVENLGYRFIENVVEILNKSELLSSDIEELSLVNNGEFVLNFSKPYIDRKTNSLNYDLTIAKLHNNDLKLGTFVVSAPLDENLMENPKLIYTMPSNKVEVKKVDAKTYKDVLHVEMHDNHTVIV